jgi:hypothetical protein
LWDGDAYRGAEFEQLLPLMELEGVGRLSRYGPTESCVECSNRRNAAVDECLSMESDGVSINNEKLMSECCGMVIEVWGLFTWAKLKDGGAKRLRRRKWPKRSYIIDMVFCRIFTSSKVRSI